MSNLMDPTYIEVLLENIESHALTTGLFEQVNRHEQKQNAGPTGLGLVADIWAETGDGLAMASGLASVTVRVAFTIRIYLNMLMEPQDRVEPVMLHAVGVLCGEYAGDFDLGTRVKNIDLLGAHGPGLGFRAGYIDRGGKLQRIYDINLPLIINDVWDEVA